MSDIIKVLSALARNWAICACYLELRHADEKRLDREKERLEYGLHPLQEEIERLGAIATAKCSGKQIKEHKERLAKVKAQLAQADADIKAKQTLVEEECDQAQDERDARLELFEAAQTFFKDEAGVGTDEILKAALVDFDRSKLQSGQLRLQERIPEIVWLLRGVPCRKWKSKPWAQPVAPSRKVSRLASPRLQSFKDEFLAAQREVEYVGSEKDEKPKNGSRASGHEMPLKDSDDPTKWTGWILTKVVKPWFGAKNIARSPTGWTKLANELRAEGLIENHPTGKAKRIRIHNDVFVRYGIKRPELTS